MSEKLCMKIFKLEFKMEEKFLILALILRSILKMVARFENMGTVHNQHKSDSESLLPKKKRYFSTCFPDLNHCDL